MATITSFTASNQNPISGDSITFNWQITGATNSVFLLKDDEFLENLTSNNLSFKVYASATYTLQIDGADGINSRADLYINVHVVTLERCEINFRTTDNDKDADSKIDLNIYINGEIALTKLDSTSGDSMYGHFDNESDQIPIPIFPSNSQIIYKGDIQNAYLKITFRPNGNDTWDFITQNYIYFTDGTQYKSAYIEGNSLSQNNEISIPLYIINLPFSNRTKIKQTLVRKRPYTNPNFTRSR